MVVRFDNNAVQQTVESKAEPIGVEGDPTSVKGGISEADAIVKEARKSMGNGSKLDAPEEDFIREEEEKEPGPVCIHLPLIAPFIPLFELQDMTLRDFGSRMMSYGSTLTQERKR